MKHLHALRPLHLGVSVFSLFALAVLAPISSVSAQERVPATASPGRVQQQVPSLEQLDMKTMPQINIPEVRTEGAPEGADKIAFTLRSLKLEGVTAYPEGALASIYQDDIGKTISLTRLYAIAGELTRKYRNDGYIITQTVVPPQTIEGGDVTLQIVEGSLDQVIVDGQVNDTDGHLIRALGNKLRASQPLKSTDLERYLLLINDLPGVHARSVIGPSPTQSGKADMRIIIDRTAANFALGADNYGSRYLGPGELTAAAQINNVLDGNDSFTAQIVTAPHNREMYYGYGAYQHPIGTEGATITTDLSYSDTTPGYDVAIFQARGFTTTLGATLEYPFMRSRNENLTGRFRFEGKTSSTKSALGVSTDDDIRSARIGARYEKLSTFIGTSVNMADVQVSKGLGIFGASSKGDADLSRARGNPEYTKIELEATRLQRIVQDFNILAGVKAQKATSALLASEEFGIGGMNNGYGRGYDPSEIVGDSGFSAKLEAQWNTHAFDNTIKSLQLFSFYDVGSVWNTDATTSAGKRNSLASAGVGARAHVNDTISADATMAVPLTAAVATQHDKSPRFFFSLTGRF